VGGPRPVPLRTGPYLLKHYVLVTGGRDYTDYETVEEPIRFLVGFYGDDLRMLHGGARGADSLAQRAIEKYEITHKVFPADWKTHPKAAGPIRNVQMVDYLDFCRNKGHTTQILAFPGGSGTIHCISEAEDRFHPVDRFAWES
jgi:hypothetical protein